MLERRSVLDKQIIKDARLAQEYLDIAEVIIMALDTEHNVTMINQKGASILGYPKDEIIGKNFIKNFLPSRIHNEVKRVGQDIIEEKKEFKKYYENPILTKNGEERLISWKNTQLKDDDGNPIGLLTSGEDITELRKQSQQLLQKSRLEQMGEMMSMIAHQWRQPLGAISAVTTGVLLKLELKEFNLEEEKSREACNISLSNEMKKINTYIQNLSTTINDFRNFYKVDKDLEWVTLSEVVESALNIISASFNENNIEFIKEYTDKNEMEILYSEMIQVILNILQNSKNNFEDKKIKNPQIKVSIEDNMIAISDNGGGILDEIIDKIFDPYFSMKENKNGTGLGLYMSKIIVEDHHKGKLRVENTRDGVCFFIDLKPA